MAAALPTRFSALLLLPGVLGRRLSPLTPRAAYAAGETQPSHGQGPCGIEPAIRGAELGRTHRCLCSAHSAPEYLLGGPKHYLISRSPGQHASQAGRGEQRAEVSREDRLPTR